MGYSAKGGGSRWLNKLLEMGLTAAANVATAGLAAPLTKAAAGTAGSAQSNAAANAEKYQYLNSQTNVPTSTMRPKPRPTIWRS